MAAVLPATSLSGLFPLPSSVVSALPGRFPCISPFAREHEMTEITSSGGQGGSLAGRAKTQLGVPQPLGCTEMTEAKPVLERQESMDHGESS